MKILHTADWHIGQFKGPVVDGVNLRLQDTVKCLEYMVEVAQKEKPDIVCISGDIFHQEQIGPVRYSDEMIIATDTITKLADIAKGVIVMRGTPNHDGSGQFRVLDRMFVKTSHVHIITAPTVLHTPYTDIACIPGFDKQEFRAKFPGLSADEENLAWTKYISDMVFALRAECEKTPILMAHYTVPGCNMESGQTSFFTNFEPVIPSFSLVFEVRNCIFCTFLPYLRYLRWVCMSGKQFHQCCFAKLVVQVPQHAVPHPDAVLVWHDIKCWIGTFD